MSTTSVMSTARQDMAPRFALLLHVHSLFHAKSTTRIATVE